jgi:ABC-type antimicrobial peptide transport system permease subunit
MLGLVASTAWLAVAQARLVARRTGWAPALLAARRIQADPRAQARALSAVLLATFFAAGSSVLRAEAGVVSRDDPFFTAAYNLVDLALLVALVVSGAGLVVSTAEQISERRRSLATLTATGVPRSVLQRSAVVQALLPAVPMVLLAAALGAWSARILLHEHSAPLPLARLSGIVGIALLVVLLSCLCTLPALRRAAAPGELRWT